MSRFFNTEGPCRAGRHYMLPPLDRLPELREMVERERYFVLHAPRQVGKSTAMLGFAEQLRANGYVALRASLLGSRGVEDPERAERLWLEAVESAAIALPEGHRPPTIHMVLDRAPGARLARWLREWCRHVGRPMVLFLDEADCVRGPALTSLLAQLRDGFETRGIGVFPVSVALVGLRDFRDYIGETRGRPLSPGSPFNNVTSLRLRDFNRAEVAALYRQYTEDTGQVFTDEAVDRAFYWTEGQPWLVNAIGQACMDRLVPDRSQPILPEHVEAAKEALVASRVTHLDHLAERLKEERVARIIAPIVAGEGDIAADSDDFQYCIDLGLIVPGPARIANPLYREVLARQLSLNRQESLPEMRRTWERPGGRLDMGTLLAAFRGWWRENAEMLAEGQGLYREAAPHIALMGFLQRVVNGGGRIFREYAAGRGRMDLLVEYGGERHVIEIKRVTTDAKAARAKEEGTEQTLEYLQRVGVPEGWLIVFDARPGRSWDEKLWAEERRVDGRTIHLLGA